MIINWLMQVVLGFLGGFLSLAPAFTLPTEMSTFGTTVGSSFSTINGIFPVVTLGVCLGVIMTCWVFIVGWQIIVYVYKLIPFKAT